MFELEDFSSGFHDGFLSKYADSSGPTLDFCISDSLQDILDFDIRREIATVVGGSSEMSSLDHAIEAINNNNSNASTTNTNSSPSRHAGSALSSASSFMGSPWYGLPPSSSWSSSSDYFADVGACVDPNSVMPLISNCNSMIHQSPKVSLNANALRHRHPFSPPPPSPNEPNKSHLTFSPAQVKVSANALRNERLTSHIPKQIVAISSSVTAATTAPATMATNSALQRKQQNASVDAVKKDLAAELRKVSAAASPQASPMPVRDESKGMAANHTTTTTSNTIKLAPGIGGLTFANSITYNKLKQQSSLKSPQGSPITANGSIVLKRDRDSSPLHNMTTLTANGKIIGRANSFTPKGIASAAHSPVMQSHSASSATLSGGVASGQQAATVAPSLSSPSLHYGCGSPASVTAIRNTPSSARSSPTPMTPHLMKSQQLHKVKSSPSTSAFESEYPKPAYSYSCLIAIALKNSRSGSLPVSEIYSFMCDHFPYFKTAPSGWKNSVRHNLSLNRCFEKIEKPATNGNQRKGCLWAMKPDRIAKMDEEVLKWSRKDPMAIRNAMVFPENLEALERGEMKHGSSADSDVDADSQSEIEETSDLELEQELDDTIVENMFVEEDLGDEDIADEEVDHEHELDDDEEHLLHAGDSMLAEDNIIVLNGPEHSNQGANSMDSECEGVNQGGQQIRLVQHQQMRPATFHQRKQQFQQQQQQQQQSRDFDIQVEDIYDAIDMEDDKDVVQRVISGGQQQQHQLTPAHCLSSPSSSASSASDLIEMSSEGYQSPKRARLNINYSIGPAGELEKHVLQQQQLQQVNGQQLKPLQAQVIHRQAIKQVKLHTLQPLQSQNQQARHNHHIVVQTISAGTSTNGINTLQATNSVVSTQSIPQFQQITAIAGTNNRRKVQLVNRIA